MRIFFYKRCCFESLKKCNSSKPNDDAARSLYLRITDHYLQGALASIGKICLLLNCKHLRKGGKLKKSGLVDWIVA